MSIEIRRITAANSEDANIPNRPFEIWGRVVPSLADGRWTYRVERFPEACQMCFPDFRYEAEEDGAAFFGAYDGEECVGLAVLRRGMFRYMYLEDLKVNPCARGQGTGGLLVEECVKEAARQGFRGVYTVGQDNNASACLFYLSHGFEIGGFDNRAYGGTTQEGKADIYFYRDCRTQR